VSDSHPTARDLRALPSVRLLADDPGLEAERSRYGREAVVQAARAAIEGARLRLKSGAPAEVSAEDVRAELRDQTALPHRPVINATGVVIHTNLGRSPLAPAAQEAVREAAGYTNLELLLETGERGGRDEGIDARLRALTGAERGFAVNNGAAAAMLMLAGTSAGREVIVSRGELVEIGGGFRVPEVLTQSGCRLVEVGTTNRTRANDYRDAITPQTGALLKVHPSNFRITGFTEEVGLAELAQIAAQASLPALYDQGSGDLVSLRAAVAAGADVITCSGDKLLGGPQAGLVFGKAAWVDRLRKHPLARALRIDKLTLAGLEATLALWQSGREQEIPVARMLTTPLSVLKARAERLAMLIDSDASVVECAGATGGGARPDEPLPSFAVSVSSDDVEALAKQLRLGTPAVVARIADGALLLDVLTVQESELEALAGATRLALGLSER
jgi:L-seryl-tRNA(Ser) seleniumtransferase